MADGFVCSICGKEHAGLLTDWAFTLPDEVWEIPEPKRGEVARFNNDLCQWGERYFIRCVLEIPLIDDGGFLGWGTWAEVEWGTFERYLELYDEDGWEEPPHKGALANNLSEYGHTMGVPVLIQFREATKRPALELLPTDQSLLGLEQRQGINRLRHRFGQLPLGGNPRLRPIARGHARVEGRTWRTSRTAFRRSSAAFAPDCVAKGPTAE